MTDDAAVIDISGRLNAELAKPDHFLPAPEPGAYPDVEFLDYARWDAASNSVLSRLVPPSTPAHCLAYRLSPPQKTEALIIGDATHKALLEPGLFERLYFRRPPGHGNSNAYKDAVAAIKAANPGAEILTDAQWEIVNRVADAIRAHPAAAELLERVEYRELSLVWDDPDSGLRCKARLDCWLPALRTIVDLKSTLNASPESFAWSARKFGYHRQAALYEEAVETLAGYPALPANEHYVFIAYEKEPPWPVGVYRLGSRSLAAGAAEAYALRAKYAECVRLDYWPAYSNEIEDIDIPQTADNDGGGPIFSEGF